jgi:CheY-like chemotaxis protein
MRSILYIEDNLYNVQLVQRLLTQRPNVELLTSSQGNVGIHLAQHRNPDLILLDVHLPDIHGFDVFTILRSDPTTSDIPVIILSADATSGQNRRFLDAGAFSYMTKPLDLTALLQVVDELLGESAPSQASGDS